MTLADFLPTVETRSAWMAVTELADTVAAHRAPTADPLVLHGPPGCGKTHLVTGLHAAVTALRTGATDLAKPDPPEGARTCNLWIVEDIHRLPARGVEMLDRYLDVRMRRRRPTVLTSAIGPAELPLPPRLVSRLSGGLVVGLDLPAAASRRRLLDHLTRARPWQIEPAALEWLADRLSGVRPLLGAAQELDVLAKTVSGPITVAIVQAHWGPDRSLTTEQIAQRVAEHFRIDVAQLLTRSRQVWPCQVAMALARELTDHSAAHIGQIFGGRDASTVRHATQAVATKIAADPARAADWRRLIGLLKPSTDGGKRR